MPAQEKKKTSVIQQALTSDRKIKIEDQVGQKRMDMLKQHLNPTSPTPEKKETKNVPVTPTKPAEKVATRPSETFPSNELTKFISPFTPKEEKSYLRVVQAMKDRPDLFTAPDLDMPRIEQMDYNYERLKYLVLEKKCFSMETLEHDPTSFFAGVFAAAYFDQALSTKIMLQFSFWGGTLLSLGTQRHRKYLEKIETLELMGSYAITELAHGSNVKGIQTTARYCKETDTFEINTPNRESCKFWIGNSRHCHMCLVFAQLYVGDENHGVHCLVVPVRNPSTNEIYDGVTIGDCTVKEGLNNLDNGFLMFNKVHVPRENLLNKYGDVTPEGLYVSEIKSSNQRFGAMMSTLTMGRTTICVNSAQVLSKVLFITLGFSFERRQFGLPNQLEYPVINFQSQKTVLYPMLAKFFAFRFASNQVFHLYVNRTPETTQKLHVMSAGYKAYLTDATQTCILKLREKCGGLGFSNLNRIGQAICNHDIYKTFEGDNTVLLQEVSKYLLANYNKVMTEKYSSAFSSVGYYLLDSLNDNVKSRQLKNSTNILDSNFYLSLFDVKLEKQVQSAALRFRNILNELNLSTKDDIPKEQKKALNHFNAWNMVQNQLLDAATSYIENELLTLFHSKVEECKNPTIKKLLTKQLNLFVVDLLEKNMTYFLTHQLISPEVGKQLVKEKSKIIDSIDYAEILNIVKAVIDQDSIPVPICNVEGLTSGKVSSDPSPIYSSMLQAALSNKQLFGNATKEKLGL